MHAILSPRPQFGPSFFKGQSGVTHDDVAPADISQLPSASDSYFARKIPEYAIHRNTFTFQDYKRMKEIPTTIYSPLAASHPGCGSFPVIVFSHGLFGDCNGYAILGKTLASHGYVCIHPTHRDSIAMIRETEGLWSALWKNGLKGIIQREVTDPQRWRERADDINFIINKIVPLLSELLPHIAGHVDAESIAFAGHSYGALTGLFLGGVPVKSPGTGEVMNMHNSKIQCFLLMSPQGERPSMGLTKESFAQFQRPVMAVTGTRDADLDKRSNPHEWRRAIFDFSSHKLEKYLVVMEDADHGLGGISGRFAARLLSHRVDAKKVHYVCASSIAFFDAHLRGMGSASEYLKTNRLQKCAGHTLSLESHQSQ